MLAEVLLVINLTSWAVILYKSVAGGDYAMAKSDGLWFAALTGLMAYCRFRHQWSVEQLLPITYIGWSLCYLQFYKLAQDPKSGWVIKIKDPSIALPLYILMWAICVGSTAAVTKHLILSFRGM